MSDNSPKRVESRKRQRSPTRDYLQLTTNFDSFCGKVQSCSSPKKRKLSDSCLAASPTNDKCDNIQYTTITALKLKQLISCTNYITFLLVDCRSTQDFERIRMQFSINARFISQSQPICYTSTRNLSCSRRLKSKMDVVKFLLEECPTILEFLNAPGYYKDIVVYEDFCKTDMLSNSVKILLDAMLKWNENTKTNVYLLEEGFRAFSKLCPTMLISYGMIHPPHVFSDMLRKLEQRITSKAASTDRRRKQLNNLEVWTEYLKYTTDIHWCKAVCVRKIKSLKAVITITVGQWNETKSQLDVSAFIPDNAKCEICTEVLSAEIYILCDNGHSFCSNCSEKLTRCPKCRKTLGFRTDSGTRIRNRNLENLVQNTKIVDCPYHSENGCKAKLSYSQVAAHLKICGIKNEEQVYNKVRSHLNRTIYDYNMLAELTRTVKIQSEEYKHGYCRNEVADMPGGEMKLRIKDYQVSSMNKASAEVEKADNLKDYCFAEKNIKYY